MVRFQVEVGLAMGIVERNAPYKSDDRTPATGLEIAVRIGHSKGKGSFNLMPNYRRPHIAGGTYFLTQVTYQRERWFCGEVGRRALRESITTVRQNYPFEIDAFVLLPDHFHGLWTLPPDDGNLSIRVRLIKTYVTKHYGKALGIDRQVSVSRQKRGESNLWQRRFWEHLIRDERDFALHCDYIHINPVNHGLCEKPQD